jgi:hypothetical protein
VFVGINQDNIYGPSAGAQKIGTMIVYKPEAIAPLNAPPVFKDDSVLLPTAVGKPGLGFTVSSVRWYTYAAVAALVVLIMAGIRAVRGRSPVGAKDRAP